MRALFPVLALLLATAASARPEGPRLFCQTYPDAPACAGNVVSCEQCHTSVPEWNPYGIAVLSNLTGPFESSVVDALAAVETGDADGDGVTNLEEIMLGTWAGNADSVYVAPPAPTGDDNPRYDVGGYDLPFAYKRMKITYCGASPTYDEMQALTAAGDPGTLLHDELTACLQTSYWRDEALQRLADKRIRPLAAVGTDPGSVIPLADYRWDYRLFSYIMTDGRDVRDLLLADYHVDESGNVVTGVINDGDFGQPLEPQYRAGMITTQWFIMIHTMFSELPRTTAAQAYRAYLGLDIARSQGLLPVPGEPVDVDNAGVTEQTCANCHSTLDPLAYGFAYYEGIDGPTGEFRPNRPSWNDDTIVAAFMDTPLANVSSAGVTDWASNAAESDAFKRNVAKMLMEQAIGDASPYEQTDLLALWQSMEDDGYSADALIHRLVDTNAFGAP